MIGNFKKQGRFSRVIPVLMLAGIALLAASVLSALVFTGTENPYPIRTFPDTAGRHIDRVFFSGQPPQVEAAVARVPEPNLAMGINVLTDVPAFDWCYGCSPTAAAMLFGYYDNKNYVNLYTGPANGGVVPMDNSIWGSNECPLSATHQGIDGLETKGHVDDYWIVYTSTADDPFIGGSWTEHTHADCTGDFMGSNQSSLGNSDGGTWFHFDDSGAPVYDYTDGEPFERDGCHGMRLFAESRGYTVVSNYSQCIKGHGTDANLGFTFDDFRAEIDAGRPVLIHVANDTTDHTMLGYGYNTTGSVVYIHDTWDHNDHEMIWGGIYSDYDLEHEAVTVIELEDLLPPTVSITANDVAIDDSNIGVDAFTITAAFSEEMDNSYVPSLVFDPLLTSTLTNPNSTWSDGDTAYTWTFDIEDAGVCVSNVDVTVDGGRDLAGNAQVPGTNADYIDIDTQNPTVSIAASDLFINDSDSGIDAFTITAAFSEEMDNSYVPSLVFDPLLTSTLTNPNSTWSDGDTAYTWTFDIEDASIYSSDIDLTVDGGRDLAGNTQVPGTNADYIDVDTQNPTVSIAASNLFINDSDVGIDAFTITAAFSEEMDNSYVPSLVFDPLLTSTLTNPDGAWSADDTVYTWTFDIEDAGMHASDIELKVDGGRDLAGNAQVPGTSTDYIDIDTQNPTVTIIASDVFIDDSDVGVDAFTITTTFSETMDNSYTPTVVFDPALTSTLTNPSGAWSNADTVYTWTFDIEIEDAGVKVDDVDVTVDGGRDLASNALVPGTNTGYIDVDTQNPAGTILASDVSIVASDVSINDSDAGIDALTITAAFSEEMDSSYVPTLVFDPPLTSTLTNPSGFWSAGNTVYTWTFDIEDAGVQMYDVDVIVSGGRDLDGNTQVTDINADYIDVDTQNPTVIITDITDSVNAFASITGTASDASPGGIQKVEVVIENATDHKYWDGSSWVSNETWLDATGTTSWSYAAGSVTSADGMSYIAKARATDKAGNTSTTDSDSFTFCETLVADFQAAPANGNAPLTVQFIDESTGTINTYTWDFGDGQTGNEQNPSHTYDRPGTYTVMFTVTGTGGTDTEVKSDLVTVEKSGEAGGCTCPATEKKIPMSEVLIGLAAIFLCLAIGHYLLRRAVKPGK